MAKKDLEEARAHVYASDAWREAQSLVEKYMHAADKSSGEEREAFLAQKAEAIAKRDEMLPKVN